MALEGFADYAKMNDEQKREVFSRASQALQLSPLNPCYHYIRSLCMDSGNTLDSAWPMLMLLP